MLRMSELEWNSDRRNCPSPCEPRLGGAFETLLGAQDFPPPFKIGVALPSPTLPRLSPYVLSHGRPIQFIVGQASQSLVINVILSHRLRDRDMISQPTCCFPGGSRPSSSRLTPLALGSDPRSSMVIWRASSYCKYSSVERAAEISLQVWTKMYLQVTVRLLPLTRCSALLGAAHLLNVNVF